MITLSTLVNGTKGYALFVDGAWVGGAEAQQDGSQDKRLSSAADWAAPETAAALAASAPRERGSSF